MIRNHIIALLTATALAAPAAAAQYNSEDHYVPPVSRSGTASTLSVERSTVAAPGFLYDQGSYVRLVPAPAPSTSTVQVTSPPAHQALRDESGISVLR